MIVLEKSLGGASGLAIIRNCGVITEEGIMRRKVWCGAFMRDWLKTIRKVFKADYRDQLWVGQFRNYGLRIT